MNQIPTAHNIKFNPDTLLYCLRLTNPSGEVVVEKSYYSHLEALWRHLTYSDTVLGIPFRENPNLVLFHLHIDKDTQETK